jgi:histone deacetylase complex regulatory component SIN3
MLTEIDKIQKIYLTFPVTSATAERSFSSLRRVKTYLRNTMSHCRLNNLFLLYVQTNKLDLVTVAKEVIGVNSRPIRYFAQFVHSHNFVKNIPIEKYLPTPL